MNKGIDMRTRVKHIVNMKLFLPIVSLLLVLTVNVIKTPSFFTITINNGVFYGYIIDIINRSSELVIMAVGMTLVVASSGGADISVGAVSAVSGAVIVFVLSGGETSTDFYHNPYILGVLAAVAAGGLCGVWNGFLVAKMKIQPMVATLILFTAGRGIAQLITGGQILYLRVDHYKGLGGFIPGIPLPTPVFVAIFVVLLTYLLLKKTPLGLYIEAVGINGKASRLVGLNPIRIQFLAYVASGLCAGIAGLIITSRVYSIDANNAGLNMELDAILAVALGGNSLAGGKFTLIGSVVGAITIQTLTTTLYAMKISADQLPVYKAVVVIIIVSLQSSELKRMVRNLQKKLTAGKRQKEAI